MPESDENSPKPLMESWGEENHRSKNRLALVSESEKLSTSTSIVTFSSL